MASLSLVQIEKYYQDHWVIPPLDLSINDGEFVVIVGPSGCGKSTLLRLIAGLEPLQHGKILIDNKDVKNSSPADRNIAMVFQNYALYPHMTVYHNLAYGLKMRKLDASKIQARVLAVAERLNLTPYLYRKPRDLSGGQRQRVAMGRAIVREPAIFLFDEPLSNLDAKLRVQMRLELKKMQQNLRTTSLYVTHDQVEAMTLADRLVVFNQGRIEQVGTPLEIYHHPATLFVASFIGSPAMNFLPASLVDHGKAVCIAESVTLPLSKTWTMKDSAVNLTLGIRPESLIEAPASDLHSLEVQLDWIESLGADTLVYCRAGKGQHLIAARLPGAWEARGRTTIQLAIMLESVHLFDTNTGKKIYTQVT